MFLNAILVRFVRALGKPDAGLQRFVGHYDVISVVEMEQSWREGLLFTKI